MHTVFPRRPSPCGRAGQNGLCETSFAWRLLLRDVWPRFGSQPYSTTSEKPQLPSFNNYRDIPQNCEGVTWQIKTRPLKSSCSCATVRSPGRARHRTGLISTVSAMSTPFQYRAGPEPAPLQVCSPMPPQIPIPMSCDRAEYSQPDRPTKRRASGRCTPRPRQPTA